MAISKNYLRKWKSWDIWGVRGYALVFSILVSNVVEKSGFVHEQEHDAAQSGAV